MNVVRNDPPSPGTPALSDPAWFCIRTHPKHEHIAAACLRMDFAIDCFLPRIRFKRATPRGPVWFTEALFPGYLFALFDLWTCLAAVQHARGVRGVVHFADRWPSVPEQVIAHLQAAVGREEVHVIRDEVAPGETVDIAGGAFHGLRAVVTRVMPSRERVAVLLDLLGRQTTVELASNSLVRAGDRRGQVLGTALTA